MVNETRIPQLTEQLSEIEKSIANITTAIEKGIASETLMNRLVQLEHEKKTINKEIKSEEKYVYRIDRDQIVFWLSQFKYGNIEDESFRRRLIDLLVNSVTVWDEPDGYKITTAYNLTSCKTKTFRVEKSPATENVTGFGFGESECAMKKSCDPWDRKTFLFFLLCRRSCRQRQKRHTAQKRTGQKLRFRFGNGAFCVVPLRLSGGAFSPCGSFPARCPRPRPWRPRSPAGRRAGHARA